MKLTPKRMKLLLNLYGPYLGAGVRVTHVAPDWREIRVILKPKWYNRNAVGTHFGGSLYAMVDPHLMLLLMQLLGKGYVVWDKSAAIEFVRPGRGTVSATIRISDEDLDRIHDKTATGEKYLAAFTVHVTDVQGQPVADVQKVLYVRKKRNP